MLVVLTRLMLNKWATKWQSSMAFMDGCHFDSGIICMHKTKHTSKKTPSSSYKLVSWCYNNNNNNKNDNKGSNGIKCKHAPRAQSDATKRESVIPSDCCHLTFQLLLTVQNWIWRPNLNIRINTFRVSHVYIHAGALNRLLSPPPISRIRRTNVASTMCDGGHSHIYSLSLLNDWQERERERERERESEEMRICDAAMRTVSWGFVSRNANSPFGNFLSGRLAPY